MSLAVEAAAAPFVTNGVCPSAEEGLARQILFIQGQGHSLLVHSGGYGLGLQHFRTTVCSPQQNADFLREWQLNMTFCIS